MLIAHYKLDGDTTDSTLNGSATILSHASVLWETGKINQCATINGVSSNDIIVNPTIKLTSVFSFSFFAKRIGNSATGIGGLVANSRHANCTGATIYFKDDSTNIYFTSGNGTTRPNYTMALNSVNTDWHHYAVTYGSDNKVKIYQDGVLIDNRVILPIVHDATNYVAIGRWSAHYANYTLNGNIDDVRIYNNTLSAHEVKDLSLAKVLHYKFDQDDTLDCSGYNNHGTNSGGVWTSDSKIGKGAYEFTNTTSYISTNYGLGLNPSITPLTICGWVYPTVTSSIFFSFVGSSAARLYVGIISDIWSIGIQSSGWGAGSVSAVYNQWCFVSLVMNGSLATLKINGVVSTTKSYTSYVTGAEFGINNYSGYRYPCKIDDVRVYSSALTDSDLEQIYKTRASLDDYGNLYSHCINETKHQPMIVDYTTWQDGQSGNVTGFVQNGSTTQNYRVLGLDPWGKHTVLWEARADRLNVADGGWVTSPNFNVDNTKLYRFSVWVNRTVQGDGLFYLGTNGFGSVSGVYRRSDGTNQTNPYFWYGSITTAEGWQLVVGHIWPVNSGVGSNHVDSGRYYTNGQKFGSISYDFVWRAETITYLHRSYLYYSSDTSTRQQWCYPRVDICDGTEPSINELLSGHDSRNIDYIRQKGGTRNISLDIGNKVSNFGELNEIGPTNGLVAYYPFYKNATDYSVNKNDGVVSGATLSQGINGGMSYKFLNNGDKITISPVSGDGNVITMCAWHKWDTTSTTWRTIYGGSSTTNHLIFNNDRSVNIFDGSTRSFGYSSPDNEWHQYVVILYSATNAYLYVDGVYRGETVTTLNLVTYPIITIGNWDQGNNYPVGYLTDCRLYNRSLTSQEISILYNITGPTNNNMKQTETSLYLRGQFKETF